MQDFAAQHGAQRFNAILDIGCSAGISTRALAEAFPEAASVAGLDLSPHFLAVAEYRERCGLGFSQQWHSTWKGAISPFPTHLRLAISTPERTQLQHSSVIACPLPEAARGHDVSI